MLDKERELSCDLVLVSAGVRPNIDLAVEAGIEVNRGVVVDEYLQTSANDVYAIGDVAEFGGRIYGIIPAALEQAKIAAMNMSENGKYIYQGTIPSNTLKIVGIDLTSMGLVNPEGPRYEEIKKIDKKEGVYKKIVLEQGRIVGAIILGDRKGVTSIKKLMDRQVDTTKHKNSLLEDNFDYKKVFS